MTIQTPNDRIQWVREKCRRYDQVLGELRAIRALAEELLAGKRGYIALRANLFKCALLRL